MGLSNHKFFLLFLLYVFTLCVFSLVLVGGRFMYCAVAPKHDATATATARGAASGASGAAAVCKVGAGSAIATLMLVLMALLFAIFTLTMMCDQYPALRDGMTMIDRHQARDRAGASSAAIRQQRRSTSAALAEVFGGRPQDGFRWHWLVPTAVHYPDPEGISGFSLRTVRPRVARSVRGMGTAADGGRGLDSDGEDEALEDDGGGDTDSDAIGSRKRF